MTSSFTNMDRAAFKKAVQVCDGGPVPFILSLPNDVHTPVGLYANLSRGCEYAFLLESVEHGSSQGRYSFMGCEPRRVISYRDGKLRSVRPGQPDEAETIAAPDPLAALAKLLEPQRASWPADQDLPPLLGGLVGYLAYDCVHYFEPVGPWLPDELDQPEMLWLQTDIIVGFDHARAAIFLSKCLLPDELSGDLDQLYDQVLEQLNGFLERYFHPPQLESPRSTDILASAPPPPPPEPPGYQAAYEDIVERSKQHIRAGDVFQVVPSQRYALDCPASALDIYRRLRNRNPSPYMFALKLDDFEVAGSSPETQLRCIDGRLTMRPLAGTRPRSGDRQTDEARARELLADEKECAEHRMLVDLVRNDLGRVAQRGSVSVDRLLEVEHYSHVMHITSEVSATLADDQTVFDAMRATFPAGTLSGAPKVRAMQLINGFEDRRRNLYGGLVGYIDYAGNCDSCIGIRMVMRKQGKAYVQAGAGLVADSQPTTEFRETQAKAKAVMDAIALASASTPPA